MFFIAQYDDLSIRRAVRYKPKPPVEGLVFGQSMTDHMLEVHWTQDQGWGPPAIVPYHSLSIDPAAKCLHYSLEVGIYMYMCACLYTSKECVCGAVGLLLQSIFRWLVPGWLVFTFAHHYFNQFLKAPYFS